MLVLWIFTSEKIVQFWVGKSRSYAIQWKERPSYLETKCSTVEEQLNKTEQNIEDTAVAMVDGNLDAC